MDSIHAQFRYSTERALASVRRHLQRGIRPGHLRSSEANTAPNSLPLHQVLAHLAADHHDELVPDNLLITASWGGKYDHLIQHSYAFPRNSRVALRKARLRHWACRSTTTTACLRGKPQPSATWSMAFNRLDARSGCSSTPQEARRLCWIWQNLKSASLCTIDGSSKARRLRLLGHLRAMRPGGAKPPTWQELEDDCAWKELEDLRKAVNA